MQLVDGKYIFKLRTGRVTVRVSASFEYTYERCKKYLVSDDAPFDEDFSLTKEEAEAFLEETRVLAEKEGADLFLDAPADYYEYLLLHKKLSDVIAKYDALMFHCSSIAVDGEAVLFTAPSGTGKSTHARNWKKLFGERMCYINDDKPYVEVREADATKEFIVHGTPWNGKHNLGEQASAPIKAIGIITRDEKNFVERVPQMQAFTIVYQQVYFPTSKEMMKRTVELMSAIANDIPVYRIHCNMEPESAKAAYEGIFGKQA